MHAIRHWNHQDLPSTVSALSHLRQLFRLYMTMIGCTVPLPLDKSRAPPCDILKQRHKAKIYHRKTTVSTVLKDNFGEHKPQRDDDTKALAILLTYLEEKIFFFRMHSRNVERAETLGIFLHVLHVTT